MDENACNYDPNANVSNNTCISPTLFCKDLSGNGEGNYTTHQFFCQDPETLIWSNDQISDAVYSGYTYNQDNCNDGCDQPEGIDECGICGGGGIELGECDCDGNVEDCEGECNGNAVIDECGVCGGDGESCDIHFQLFQDYGYGNPGVPQLNALNVGGIMNVLQDTNLVDSGTIPFEDYTIYVNGFNELQFYLSFVHNLSQGDYVYLPSLRLEVQASGNYLEDSNVQENYYLPNDAVGTVVKVRYIMRRTIWKTSADFSFDIYEIGCHDIYNELLEVSYLHTNPSTDGHFNANGLGITDAFQTPEYYLNIFSNIISGTPGYNEPNDLFIFSEDEYYRIRIDIKMYIEDVDLNNYTPQAENNITFEPSIDNMYEKTFFVMHSGIDSVDESCLPNVAGDINNDGNVAPQDWWLAGVYKYRYPETNIVCQPDSTHWNNAANNIHCCSVANLTPPYNYITENDIDVMYQLAFSSQSSGSKNLHQGDLTLLYGNGECEIRGNDVKACQIFVDAPVEVKDNTSHQFMVKVHDNSINFGQIREGDSELTNLFNYTGDLKVVSATAVTSDGNLVSCKIKKVMDYAELLNTKAEDMTMLSEELKTTSKKNNIVTKMKIVDPIVSNLNSIEGQFYLENGTPYSGQFHIHSDQDGQRMSGANHTKDSENLYFKDEIDEVVFDKLILANYTNYSNTKLRKRTSKRNRRK